MRSKWIALSLIIIIFGGIYVSKEAGLWDTEVSKTPTKFVTGENQGANDPEAIRGSYTFAEIETHYGVPAEVLATAFSITSDNPAIIACKDLEALYTNLPDGVEIGTGSVKQYVSIYTGLPYLGDDVLPLSAKESLDALGLWSSDLDIELISLEKLTYSLEDKVEEGHEEVDYGDEGVITELKGKTTVAEVLSTGVTLEEIEAVLGVEIGNNNLAIRDICTNNGLQFGEIKIEINNLIAQVD